MEQPGREDALVLLKDVAMAYRVVLGDNLVGIYAHGSLAFGCFHWDNSDIDFLEVVKEPLSLGEKEKLIRILLMLSEKAPKKGFEMSVFLHAYCQRFTYPTPYELHFSNTHLQSCENDLAAYCAKTGLADIDLAAHFTVTRHVGICVYGSPVRKVFEEVPAVDYFDRIARDVENAGNDILHDPVYVILNLCRVLAFVRERLVLSKEQGGRWALEQPDMERYHPVIVPALNGYMKNESPVLPPDLSGQFCDEMLQQILPSEWNMQNQKIKGNTYEIRRENTK